MVSMSAERPGALSPLAYRTFRWLWIAMTVSIVGIWMQSLGAQWFIVTQPDGAALVALVQTATTLPMALLALPAGVLADTINRRTLLLGTQVVTLLTAVALTALMALDLLNIAVLLILTLVLSAGNGMSVSPFQSLAPDLLPRSHVPAGAALNSLGVNLARIVGPAIAGFLVAWIGIAAVFALTAITAVFYMAVLLRWRGIGVQEQMREPFFPAVRSGWRYVRHSPQAMKLIIRSFWFTAPMMAIMALTAVVARERLGMDSSGLGVLMACTGAGAVAGALSLARLRRRLTTNAIVAMSTAAGAVATIVLPFLSERSLAMACMALSGASWTMTNSSMNGAMQVYLPSWVRARGLAMLSMALFGGQAVGSIVVGWLFDSFGLTMAFVVSGLVMLAGATTAAWLPLRELFDIDRSPSARTSTPDLLVDPERMDGEIDVVVTYWVDAADESAFVALMQHVRRTRLRTGGRQWRLAKDGRVERRYVETYTIGSWREHELQSRRVVASDRNWEEQVMALSSPPPQIERLFRLDVRETGWR